MCLYLGLQLETVVIWPEFWAFACFKCYLLITNTIIMNAGSENLHLINFRTIEIFMSNAKINCSINIHTYC